MDVQTIIFLFQKEFKTYDDLKQLDLCVCSLVEPDSAFNKLSQTYRYQVIQKLTLLLFNDDEIIFSKGDTSDCLYIILSGSLQMFTMCNGVKTIEKVLSKGVIGERGIVKNKYRSLSASALGDTYLLRLDANTFKKYLIGEFTLSTLVKREIVDKYIPCINQFTGTQKEKISYALELQEFPRGKVLLKQGNASDALLIIQEGECAMILENGSTRKIIAILDCGSIIGEDSMFFERNSLYTIVVTSEKVKAAVLKNIDFKILFPAIIINGIKNLISQRNFMRNKLASFSNPCLHDRKSFLCRNTGRSNAILSPPHANSGYLKEKMLLNKFSVHSIFNK